MKARLHAFFRDSKLSGKMILVYILLLGCSCALALIALQFSLHIYEKQLYQKSLQELDFFAQQIGDSLDDIEDVSRSLAMGSSFQRELASLEALPYPTATYSYQMYLLRQTIMDHMNASQVIKSITYLDTHGNQLPVGEATPITDAALADFSARLDAARGAEVLREPDASCRYLLSGRAVLETAYASLRPLGRLVLTCDVAGVIGDQMNALEAEHSALKVYGAGGTIYQSENIAQLTLPEITADQGYQLLRQEHELYFMCYLRSAKTGWMFVNVFPYKDIFGQTMQVHNLMIVGFLAIFLCSALLMRRLAKVITTPLARLSDAMHIAETGDFHKAGQDLALLEPSGDEVGQLTREFGSMLDKIDNLIYENYEKQMILQDTRYKMLQAQINPHFLYNTLNTLSWLVKAGRDEDAGQMIVALGQLLRASLSPAATTTVAQDVALVESYIAIQQKRYQKRADFSVTATGALDRWIVPHITLQPLVENAIYHGVENSLSKCSVTVRVTEEPNNILMEVCDTGPGIAPDELAAAQAFAAKPRGHGIGMKNIKERLDMLFGHCEFTIESELGKGTQVRIRIPKLEGGNEHGQDQAVPRG